MFMEALGGQVSREEGWVIFLTTQSDDPPAGVFKEKLGSYRDVRDGKILDRKSLGVLYEFPPDMLEAKAYLQPENFHITNPNIGRSVSREWLEDQLRKMLHKTDGSLQQFLAKHLNVEIGLNLRSDRWAGADFWERNAEPGLSLDDLLARCEVVELGIDGGGLDDLLGFAALGREPGTGRWLHWGHAWAHQSVLERRKSEAARFRDFEAAGDLTIVDQMGDDVAQVGDLVEKVLNSGLLDRIGVDPVGIGSIVDEMVRRGVEESQIQGISQGWRLNGAIKTTERKLAEGSLRHAGQPLMAYSASNAKAEAKGNAVSITKQVAGAAKIDPLMALFNAVALLSMNPSSKNFEAGYSLLTV
jgi:phage terminase large subunit-like protein